MPLPFEQQPSAPMMVGPDSPSGPAPVPQLSTLNSVSAPLPFTPEPGESRAAFEAFLCYLDIGKNRSCGEVARRTGASASAARRWSGKFKWKQRMAAYHQYEMASALVQIGIVLASAHIITGVAALLWISGALGLAGVVFCLIGFFAPTALHLF